MTQDGVDLRDEREFTPSAAPGWQAWDAWSPEREFCAFVGAMQRMLQPATVVETGVGIGRLTGFLDIEACEYLGFESDPAWRRPPADPGRATPETGQIAAADLVILDSAPDFRVAEIALWATCGKPGSVCLVHDCGSGDGDRRATHRRIRRAVTATGLPGVFLHNPRGGWLGWRP